MTLWCAFIFLSLVSPSSFVDASCQWLEIDGSGGRDIRGGRSVSLDGNFVAVGDPEDGEEIESPVVPGLFLPDASGRARVYDITDPQNWVQIGQDLVGEEAGLRLGHSVSLAANGTLLAVSTPDATNPNSTSGSSHGRVQVYERSSDGQWTPLGQTLYGFNESMKFGSSVALSSNKVLAVGASQFNRLLPDGSTTQAAGLVQTFQYNGTNWGKLGSDFIGDRANDELGDSVALSADGKTLGMSSSRTQSNLRNALSEVFQFNDNTTSWKFVGSFTGGRSSLALSADGTVIAGGDGIADGSNGAESAGMVKAYKLPGPGSVGLMQLGADLEGSASNDGFGSSISLSQDGSIMIAGASLPEIGGTDYVSAFKYDVEPNSTSWIPVGDRLEGEAEPGIFGDSVSISQDGSTFVTGGDSLSLFNINDVNCLEDPTIVVPTMAPVETTAPPPTVTTTSTASAMDATTTSNPLGSSATTTSSPVDSTDSPQTSGVAAAHVFWFAVLPTSLVFVIM